MSITKPKITIDNLLLLIILIVAGILRFWNFTEIPYMHDELSALARTSYTNLQDEIVYGVAIHDTHPAGVQLFLYYWIKILGMSEIRVKLPFILCGLLSIIIAYKISKKWFNSSVGLIVASFMATLQYMVMYSQIARPYMSGMLFSLLMVWCWSNYLFEQNTGKNKWLIAYVLSSVLCAYNHHFSLLFASIVGITGLFFLNNNNWKAYVFAGVLIFILYIPHLGILFFQLNKGGLGGPDGWLGKPDLHWFSRYIKYIFHYSYLMYVLAFLLLLLSIFFQSNDLKTKQKFRIISISWFFILFFIEYYYSLFINPIIQYSTLIFVFPFFLMFLFSLLAELKQNIKTLVVLSILIAGSYTLIVFRKHYQVFYKQPAEQLIQNTYRSLDELKNKQDVTIELMIPPYFKEYYFKKYNRRFESIFFDQFNKKPDTKAFRNFVRNQTTNNFIIGGLPLEYIQIIKETYPYMISKEEGFAYSTYCFSKNKNNSQSLEQNVILEEFSLDDLSKIDSTSEYSQSYTLKLNKYITDRHCVINLSAKIFSSDSSANPVLVVDITENDKSIGWMGAEYFNYNYTKTFNTIYLCSDLSGFNFNERPNAYMKIYIWNKNKKTVLVNDFKMEVIEGNHLIYSLYEPID